MRSADILHLLREMIVALSPGDRLPAERDLAHRLKCSRQTVRAGLDVLKRDGLIWRHVGQGTFVGQRPRHLPGRPVMGGDVSPEELLRARLVLEPPIGAEAARCASDTDVGYLKQVIADGREATRHADCERADCAFHQTLGQITENPALVAVMDGLSGVRRHGGGSEVGIAAIAVLLHRPSRPHTAISISTLSRQSRRVMRPPHREP